MALIGRNTRVEIQATLGTAKTITAITKANPGVATSTGHGLANGDVVVLDPVAGMVELDGQIVRVANVAANTFELEGIDTTNYGDFTSGEAKEVTAWTTLGTARSVNAASTTPNKLDATTLIDSEQQLINGVTPAPDITISNLSDPLAAASVLVEAAARNNESLGFRIRMSDGSYRFFRGTPSLPSENIPLNDLVTADFSVTQVRRRLAYAA
jgi:hypothetical protein